MRLILKRPPEIAEASIFTGFRGGRERVYRTSARPFGLSALFHLGLIALLYWGSNLAVETERPVYVKELEPYKSKVVWYRFKSDLPNIDSPTSAKKDSPTGLKKSARVTIADVKNGSKSEFVWQNTPVKLPKEVKAPNLIALHAAEPAPPSPAPPAPETPKPLKTFVPAPATPRPQPAKAVAMMTPAPVLTANSPATRVVLAAPIILAAPPLNPTKERAVVTMAPPTLSAALPAVNGPSLEVPVPAAAPAAGAAPGAVPGNRMPESASNQPLGKLNVASINLNSNSSATLPAGRRAGEFSSAPRTGEPGANGTGAPVPGLTTRGNNRSGDSVPGMEPPGLGPPVPQKTVSYREIMSHPMGSSMSAPLRPGARTVPAGVEQKFHDRLLYTMVIPSPKLPEYAADWILWFTEREAAPQGAALIRAPVPEKKHVAEAALPNSWGSEADIQISAVIDENGTIQNAVILRAPSGISPQFALEDVRMWQFKPATRNGTAIAVEALLDIPFRRVLIGAKP